MAPQVREALRALEAAVELPTFVPATATRQFTLAANDFTTMMLATPLLKMLVRQAPAIDLAIKPVTRIDLAEQIDLGRIDVAIGVFSVPPARFRTSLLFEYDDVLIASGKHKLGRLDKAKLARLPLVVVSFGGEQEGAIGGFISERGLARRSEMYDRAALERALAESDHPLRIAVSLPHFLALARAARGFRTGRHRPASIGGSARANPCHHDLRTALRHDSCRGPIALARTRRGRAIARMASRNTPACD